MSTKKAKPTVEGIMNVFLREGAKWNGVSLKEYKASSRVDAQRKILRAALKAYLNKF